MQPLFHMPVYDKWVFVIHNFSEETVNRISLLESDPWCKGVTAGVEVCPKTGTKHIQGCLFRPPGLRIGKKKMYEKLTNGTKFWCAGARGSWGENKKYTQKDDNVLAFKDITEADLKEYDQQGARHDLEEFKTAIKRGATDAELFEDHYEVLAKYPRIENRTKMHYLKLSTRAFREVDVIVHWGEAGTGKTRKAYEDGAFIFDDYEKGWWDGYAGESAVLLDDFYGGVKWCSFLRWLDGYQVRLPVKGGHTYAQWSKLYITSNKHPNDWYKDHSLSEYAFKRRITKIIQFKGQVRYKSKHEPPLPRHPQECVKCK